MIAIDFEFRYPAEKCMGLISCSVALPGEEPITWWLWEDPAAKAALCGWLLAHREHVFIGYSIQQAEARCFAALGLNPNDFKWRDLMLEWRWLRNGDDRYSYGHVISESGFPMVTVPPVARTGKKASQEEIAEAAAENAEYLSDVEAQLSNELEGAKVGMQQAGWSLLDCQFFFEAIDFTGYRRAAETKKRVRDGMIIGRTPEQIVEAKDDILAYNADDVADLIDLADRLTDAMIEVASEEHVCFEKGDQRWGNPDVEGIQLDMGDWAARLAKYGNRGIPLHRGRLEKMLEVVPKLRSEEQFRWNREFPDSPLYRMGLSESVLAMRKLPAKQSPFIAGEFTKDSGMLQRLIGSFADTAGIKDWPKTRTGDYDTSKKVIDRYASGENLMKQYQRHQGFLSALRAFSADKQGNVEAMDYIGSDTRQRVDFGPYGTQTARNAAKAKSFCFLGPHWLRVLVDPEPGKVVIDLDFSAEETFIAAAVAGDENLFKTYSAADIYIAFAQLCGMYPSDLPVPTEDERAEEWFKPHKKTRNISKTLFLSQQFGAGAKSIAATLRVTLNDPGITDEDGQGYVESYREAYPELYAFSCELKRIYKPREGKGSPIMLQDGWRMGIDNPSALSAGNLPVQGLGSVILREACKRLDAAGFTVIATLHDAVTLYEPENGCEERAALAAKIMREAADYVLGRKGLRVGHPEIVRHGELWLHSEKAQEAWKKIGQYFASTTNQGEHDAQR